MDAILAKLEPLLGPVQGAPVALEGGITNRNFRVRMGQVDYVVRVAGRDTELLGIDRDAERAAAEAAHRAGVAPAVAAHLEEDGCLVTVFLTARPMVAADVRAQLPRVAQALRAVHAAPPIAAAFSPFRVGERYLATTRERGGDVPAVHAEAQAVAAELEGALGAFEPVLCHNDLLPGNLLEDGRLWVIDWDYAGMGDRCFDLGNLSVNNDFTLDDDRALVEAYFGVPDERRLARVRLMRVASDWREAMWGVVQQVLSDLDFDFAGYADDHFTRLLESDWKDWIDAASA